MFQRCLLMQHVASQRIHVHFVILYTYQTQLIYKVTTLQTMWNSLTFPRWFAALLPTLSVTHIIPVLVLLSVMGAGMQQCMIRNQNEMQKLSKIKNGHKYKQFYAIFPWQNSFPDTSLTFHRLLVKFLAFPWQPSNSLTFPGFPDPGYNKRDLHCVMGSGQHYMRCSWLIRTEFICCDLWNLKLTT